MTLSALVLTACQQEGTQPSGAVGKGRIVLDFSTPATYIDVQTRAEQPLENISDYDFTLSGTTAEGESVVNLPLIIDGNEAVVDAGTYTINAKGNNTLATAAATGLGTPYYEGTTVDASGNPTPFVVLTGEQTPVKILLRPANAKLTVLLATSFTSKYKTATFRVGSRSVNLLNLTDADPVPATDIEVTAYFPAGPLTIVAAARTGSHVTDIADTASGLTLTATHHITLTLTANTVTGEVIPIIGGEDYEGTFD